MNSITLRLATPQDAFQLEGLATLDGASPPHGRTIIAESDGAIVAAMSIPTGAVIADPFRPTADAVDLLAHRRSHLIGDDGRVTRRLFALLRPARAQAA
jgi:hypothetical protein